MKLKDYSYKAKMNCKILKNLLSMVIFYIINNLSKQKLK